MMDEDDLKDLVRRSSGIVNRLHRVTKGDDKDIIFPERCEDELAEIKANLESISVSFMETEHVIKQMRETIEVLNTEGAKEVDRANKIFRKHYPEFFGDNKTHTFTYNWTDGTFVKFTYEELITMREMFSDMGDIT